MLLKKLSVIFLFLFSMLLCNYSFAQMRQIYVDNVQADNSIKKISFYTGSEGYVAFRDWIGYTTDSGRTFTKKYITQGNVNYNGYSVNLTFGFGITGVVAFNQNNIVVYGDYGFVPAILYSTNGGTNFTLVFHSQYNQLALNTGITDMIFPGSGSTGYAVDGDRILKSTNGGLTWLIVRTDPASEFTALEAVSSAVVFAMSSNISSPKLLKTNDGGSSWQLISLPYIIPNCHLTYAQFISTTNGWLGMYDGSKGYFYNTIDGGTSWTLVNNPDVVSLYWGKFKFTDNNTGYNLGGLFTTWKTFDGGITWEPLSRDNSFSYLGYSNNDLKFISNSQLWTGGGHGFLELSNNSGGATLPVSYFSVDTAAYATTGNVLLKNFSRTGYSYQWSVNNVNVSTSYNSTYLHDFNHNVDTVTLVVNNGTVKDTAVKYQYFYPPVIVSSFMPMIGGANTVVTIHGINFTGVTSVQFGGIPANGFTLISDTLITAVVGGGASGNVKVFTTTGSGSFGGFIFISPPVISSFTPTSATAGATVTISGSNFTGTSVVNFNGVPATSFILISDSKITAVVPSCGSGSIGVTAAGGFASLPGFIAKPSISSFTPLSGTYGTLLTIRGTCLSDVTAVKIGSVAAKSFIINNPSSISAIVGGGNTGNITVTASSTASLGTFNWFNPPTITSFSPASGPVGTTVAITGTYFNSVTANNKVFFGSVQASVISASTTSLTVTVPVGASFEAISITNNYLTGYSVNPFLVTFPNGGSIGTTSFVNDSLPVSSISLMKVRTGDIDGDGKVDLIVSAAANGSNSGAYLFRNISTASNPVYSNPLIIGNLNYTDAVIGDIDGDGKFDLAVIGSDSIALFKNNSTPGTFAFERKQGLYTGNGFTHDAYGLCIKDFDGDGKPDVAIERYQTPTMSVYRNTSNNDSISFAAAVNFTNIQGGNNIVATDIDGDKKPDLVIPDFITSTFIVLRNKSTKGNISFDTAVSFLSSNVGNIEVGDIDKDGKTDIVLTGMSSSQIIVARNTSSIGNISFAANQSFNANNFPNEIALGDLDGDGKIDIATTLSDKDLGIFKNSSTPGNIILEPMVSYLQNNSNGGHGLAIADIDNNGKYDIVTVSEAKKMIVTYMNNVKALPAVLSFTPTFGSTGTTVIITGTNFTGTTSVSFGGVVAQSFVVNSFTSITAVVGTGASGTVEVTNGLGIGSKQGFVFDVIPVITSLSAYSGNVGSAITINGTNFSANVNNNFVKFGELRASVLSATTTSLNVRVPFGSMNAPITVAVNGKVAYSSKVFITTFSNGNSFTANSFAGRIDLYDDINSSMSDLDMDGKLDLISINNSSNSFQVLHNTSTSGNISFVPDNSFATSQSPGRYVPSDFDGDGKPDVAIICGNYVMSVLKNNSTNGNISFTGLTQYALETSSTDANDITANDIDGDGRADICIANYSSQNISIFKNSSVLGTINFEPKISLPLSSYGTSIIIRDLDGDNKPDIIATTTSSFVVYRNTSVVGTVSFSAMVSFGSVGGKITVGDFDMDSKPDIAFISGSNILIYRNTSVPGTISMATSLNITLSGSSSFYNINNNDFNGDNKPDLFFTSYDNKKFGILKNNSSPGIIAFESAVYVETTDYSFSYNCFSADFDNDARPDILIGHNVFRNQMGGSVPTILTFYPVSATSGTTITIKGDNFANVSSVSFGEVPATSYTIVSNTEITAVVGIGASGDVVVVNPSGRGSLNGFLLGTTPVISSFYPKEGIPGTAVVITGANLASTTSVSFGGNSSSSFVVNSSNQITAIVSSSGGSGDVSLTTSNGTAALGGFVFGLPPIISSFTPQSIISGGTLTINGSNFIGTTSISLGGQSATFTVVSSNQITVSVSGSAESGDLSVTTLFGIASKPGLYFVASPTILSFFPSSAASGNEIIITGKNFNSVTGVSFGGVVAPSFVIVSSNVIKAIIGAGASGNVSITNPFSTTSVSGFTFLSAATPGISNFSPSIAGLGMTVQINGSNFNNVTGVSFGGTSATSFTVVSPTKINAIVGNGSSGQLIVTTTGSSAVANDFVFTSAPVISSIAPKSAVSGSIVTINGSNFAPNPGSNFVYFGTVKAVVVSATNNSLTAIAPKGSTYSSISVTTNNLTGYSGSPFLTLASTYQPINQFSYATRTDSIVGMSPNGIGVGDIDQDGQPDIGLACASDNFTSDKIIFFKNNAIQGKVSFEAKQTINNGAYTPTSLILSDFNGDGKLDMSTPLRGDLYAMQLFQNTTSASNNNFAFTIGSTLTAQLGGFIGCSGDFDGDGKPDLAATGLYAFKIYIYKNISTPTAISFNPRVDVGASVNALAIKSGDLDNDGKVDLVVSTTSGIYVFRNTSTVGNISFAPQVKITLSSNHYQQSIALADFDNDGRLDIVCNSTYERIFSVLPNISVPGYIALGKSIELVSSTNPGSLAVGDVDGNGKIDIIVTNTTENTVSIFPNNSTVGNIAFSEKMQYPTNSIANDIAVLDIDNDGLQDIVLCNGNSNTFSVLRQHQIANDGHVFPIDLLSFYASLKNEETLLEWKTANERNFNGFDVEYGIDGLYFSKLGFVASAGLERHNFIHPSPIVGNNYYRLKLIDKDGHYKFSPVRKIYKSPKKTFIKFWPNPASKEITVSGRFSELKIYDQSGRNLILVKSIGRNSTLVPLRGLAAGAYYIKITNDNQNQIEKLIVQ